MPASTPVPLAEQVATDLTAPLLRYLSRYTGDPALARDLLQETLLRVTRGLPGFAGRADLRTWAFAIATRVAADHFRRLENRVRIVPVEEAPDICAPDTPVDDRMVVDEMNACVRQVIDSLPQDYRAALVLHDLEGLTAAEVAGVCGCSLATAKVRIHRARLRLSTALRQECELFHDPENVLRCDRKG